MRKITQEAAAAFFSGNRFSKGNTAVMNGSLYLHCNEIVRNRKNGSIEFTLAGWNTPTTRERLNGVLSVFGWKVRNIKGKPFICGDSGVKLPIYNVRGWFDCRTGRQIMES